MKTAALILAAGRGTRAGGELPKQWQKLMGRQVISYAIEVFKRHPKISHVALVMNADDIVAPLTPDIAPDQIITGGETRQASVLAGLEALKDSADAVLIHDGARPLIAPNVIDRVIDALQTHPGAAPALPVTDALWHGEDGTVAGMQDRAGLFRAQTPQGFHLPEILSAHRANQTDAADDVAVARAAGLDVTIVTGDESNIKITTRDDFARAAKLMDNKMDVRCGNGFDVHRFGPGDHVWLCGVKLPFDHGLQGHSDADVGMHAVTDAIYGALGAGDIGQHFPPSDPQWKGAASHIFLEHAVSLAERSGYRISNVDCTLICEFPKIGPHQDAMKTALAKIMKLDTNRLSVKATTSERLGFTGRGEGIAAMATATLVTA